MMRSLALLLVALPAAAMGQQADTSARMTISSTRVGVVDSAARHDPAGASSDGTPSAVDSVFVRAQQMVANGQGDAGRALVQAQLDSAPIGSPRYVTALYYRALVAPTAAGAERDLKRIVVEFPLSPESADALLRLAQLEMARGDRQQALEHLDRLLLEHPNNPSRGRASFWMGQLLLENGQTAAACARLDRAAVATPASDVELHNQIAYYQQRCVGVDTSSAARGDTMNRATQTPASAPAPMPASTPAPAQPSAPTPKTPPSSARRVDTSTTPTRRADTSSAPMYRSSPSEPARAAPAAPKQRVAATVPAPAARAPQRHPAASPASPASHHASAGRYTIQIAAFASREAAKRLSDGLVERGYDARVVPGGKYYRVRIGRYATRREAVDAAKALKAKHIDGIVTDAEP